jgi:hypothetical protein
MRRALSRRKSVSQPIGLGAAATALAFAISLTGCTTSPASTPGGRSGTVVLTPRKADQILASVMATNNRSNAALDTKLLGTYETGSAFTIDSADYEASRLAHSSSSVPFGVVPLQTVLSSVGLSGGTPARFLVVGRTVIEKKLPKKDLGACPEDDTLLVFQATARGRWQIVLEPSADAGGFAELATGGGHEASPVPAALASTAAGVPSRVANALVRYEASGSLGPFDKSDFNGACWAVPDPRAAVEQAQASGFDARELFSPAGLALTYLLRNGKALELFTLRYADTIVAPVNSPIIWHHNARIVSSSLLPAGSYSRITESGEVEIAAFVDSSGAYKLVGAYSGTTEITGDRTAPGSSTTQPTLLAFGG